MQDGPDELWTSFGMAVGGDARGPVASVSVLHSGSTADAERDLAGLRALGEPLEDSVESKPYLASQRLFDAPMEWGAALLDEELVPRLAAPGAGARVG